MAWFKVDDGLCFHPKAIAAGNSALGLWVRAGSWCGANLTGGALPRHMIGTFGAQKRDARRLVEAGLWCETEDGYQFKSWEEFQPTKAQVEADRKAGRERQAKWRERHSNGGSNAVTNSVTNGATNAAPSRPDPTVVPGGTTRGSRKRYIPDDWRPNPTHVAKASQLELNLAEEVEKFRDYDKAKGPVWKDHDAAFNTWLRNNAKWGKSRRNPYGKQQETDDLFDAAYQRALIADQNQQELSS